MEKRAAGGDSGGEEESLGDVEVGEGGGGGRWSGTGGSHKAGKRHVIVWEEFGDDFVGSNIEVYWPEDNTWWGATILQVSWVVVVVTLMDWFPSGGWYRLEKQGRVRTRIAGSVIQCL